MPQTQDGQCKGCQTNNSIPDNEEDGKSLVDDILSNGDKFVIETKPAFLPSFYSHALVISGQEYFRKNIFNMFVAKLTGLLLLLCSPSIVRILHKTGRSSKPSTAYKRYMDTIIYMVSWYETDLRNPNSRGRQSINTVRALHSAASKLAGVITQKDMALAQFGFVGIAVICSKKLGLKGNQEGLIHLWRVIGHLMGVHDRFNICRGNIQSTITACQELTKRYFMINLDDPPEFFEEMSQALLCGIWPLVVLFNTAAFTEHTRRICGCPPKKLPVLPSILLYLQISVHKLLQIQIIAYFLLPFFNFLMRFSIFAQIKIPILAYLAFKDEN